MALPLSPNRRGHIVAVEGPPDLVSTQLRLLPASDEILILPTLQHYLKGSNADETCGVPEFISRYYIAAQTRHTEATDFLQQSNEKRLVFMHGGTMSAHIACLSNIMAHETDGDIEEAHATFVRLANNVVAGLQSAGSSSHRADAVSSKATDDGEHLKRSDSPREHVRQIECGGLLETEHEDRIIRAMRAADALDKETEFLQPATPDVDLTVKLIDIPSRPGRRPISTVFEEPESFRDTRPPSPRDRPPTPTAEEAVSAALRKPPLRIRIPSPPIPWAGDVATNRDPQPISTIPSDAQHRRPLTTESKLPPRRIFSDGDFQDKTVVPGLDSHCRSLSTQNGESPVRAAGEGIRPTEDTNRQYEPALPLMEDTVIFLTPETPDELQNFVFRRLGATCQAPRPSRSCPEMLQHEGFQGTLYMAARKSMNADTAQSGDGCVDGAAPWMRKDLVHGLPTPNHSPNPLATASGARPSPSTRLYNISVAKSTAVEIQNLLRSFVASQLPPHPSHISTADGKVFPTKPGLWKALKCGGQVATAKGVRGLDLILAVGAESSVTKSRVTDVVLQLERLGSKTGGVSRSGRLDIRYLIASAMQSFTAQPLTKQTQNNPFADRALLAALIIPHLETYLETHPDIRFLLIEYPSEHLPTVMALQTLVGTEMMKVVGIVNNDNPPLEQASTAPDAERRPSEGFRSLNRRGSGTSGAFIGPCSFSNANFLLASSASGVETAAFVAAIRESLISVSDYYIPERPLYKGFVSQSPPRKTKPTTTVNTSNPPVPSQKEPFRVSVSTLIITPPSSPTEPSPPIQTSPQSRNHINPRSIPPRSSSTAASPPSRGSHSTYTTDTVYTNNHSTEAGCIRWAKIVYASSPASTSAAPYSAEETTRARHRHQNSDPLSPHGFTPASKTAPQSTSAPTARSDMSTLFSSSDEDGDDDDGGYIDGSYAEDYYVQDAEERRLMPLYLRRREDVEKGRSTKALRWLGLV